MRTTATVAVLFCDVVDSTARLTRLGDDAGDHFRRELFAVLRRCVTEHGGTEVKHLGDGLMVVFERSSISAIECAAAMHEGAADVDPDDPVHLRIGVSVGEVAHEDDDWFGTPVVEAARLCSAADADRTLAPALLEAIVGSRGRAHRFRPIGQIELKGLAAHMQVVEVDGPLDPAGGPDDATATDAVGGAGASGPGGPGGRGPRPRLRRRPRSGVLVVGVVAIAVALVAAAVAFGGGGPDDEPSTAAADDRADVVTSPVGYVPRVEQVECPTATAAATPAATCGELVVPESRTDPDGSKLRLPVVSIEGPAGADIAPVVVLDVNEGAANALAESTDVHVLSLRGLHNGGAPGADSGPHPGVDPVLSCPEVQSVWSASLAQRSDDPAAIAARVDATAACAARLRGQGVHLEGYSMAEAAADVRDLVWAADLGRVTVAAGGFTTVAAVAWAQANPGSVESLVLTNPTPPGQSALEDPARSSQLALARVRELCDADPECAAAYPDLTARFDQRSDRLAESPVVVSTRSLTGVGPFTVLLDGRRFAAALESAVRESSRLGLVPSAVAGASDELAAAAGISEDVSFFAGPSLSGAFLSLTCSYDARANRTAEVSDAALRRFAGANEATYGRLCEAWAVPNEFDRLSRPLVGDVPVLLAAGGLSVSGLNGWAEEMAEGLDRAAVVDVPTMSEDLAFTPPACLRRLRAEFISDPTGDLDTDACRIEQAPIDWVVPA